jgi:hypothetical protein
VVPKTVDHGEKELKKKKKTNRQTVLRLKKGAPLERQLRQRLLSSSQQEGGVLDDVR